MSNSLDARCGASGPDVSVSGVLVKPSQAEELVAFLRRNRLLLVAGVLLVVGGVSLFTFLAPERYRATAMIRVVDERNALTGGLADVAAGALGQAADPLLSQIQVMKSRSVLGEVVDSTWLRVGVLDGDVPPGFLSEVRVASGAAADTFRLDFGLDGLSARSGGASVLGRPGERVELAGVSFASPLEPHAGTVVIVVADRDETIARLADRLRTRTRDKTDVVLVEYTDTDPVLAQAVVNGVVDAFIRATMRSGVTMASRRREFILEQLERTDSALAAASEELTQFRLRSELYNSQQLAVVQQSGLVELEMRLDDLVSERQVYESLLQELHSSDGGDLSGMRALLAAPSIASNIVVAQSYGKLMQYQTARDTLTSGRWGVSERHPEVLKLDTLIAGVRREIVSAVEAQIQSLGARAAALTERIADARAALQALPGAEQVERSLVQQVEVHRRAAEQLQHELQKAYIAESVEAGQVEVVDYATLPGTPVPQHWPLRIAGAIVLGLFLGGGVAAVRERLDGTVRRIAESEAASGTTCVGLVPSIERDRRKGSGGAAGAAGLVAAARRPTASGDAYRVIRTNLAYLDFGRTLLITSSQPGEGKTTTSANLAASFARLGRRVLLVDADLRRPRLHSVFGMSRGRGLCEIDLDNADALAHLAVPGIEGLHVMTAGGTGGNNPADVLDTPMAREKLKKMAELFDLVILDSPPILAAPDAAVLAHFVDGVLLVVRAGLSTVATVRRSAQQVAATGGRLIGHVLNDPDNVVPLHDGCYYGYYGGSYGS